MHRRTGERPAGPCTCRTGLRAQHDVHCTCRPTACGSRLARKTGTTGTGSPGPGSMPQASTHGTSPARTGMSTVRASGRSARHEFPPGAAPSPPAPAPPSPGPRSGWPAAGSYCCTARGVHPQFPVAERHIPRLPQAGRRPRGASAGPMDTGAGDDPTANRPHQLRSRRTSHDRARHRRGRHAPRGGPARTDRIRLDGRARASRRMKHSARTLQTPLSLPTDPRTGSTAAARPTAAARAAARPGGVLAAPVAARCPAAMPEPKRPVKSGETGAVERRRGCAARCPRTTAWRPFYALYPIYSAWSSHDSSERDRAVPVGPT